MCRHLYVHIPFCHRRCAYCDFNTYANMEHRIAAYVDALCAEIRMRAQATDHGPPTTDHRPPTTDHRPPTADHGPRTTDHRPPTASITDATLTNHDISTTPSSVVRGPWSDNHKVSIAGNNQLSSTTPSSIVYRPSSAAHAPLTRAALQPTIFLGGGTPTMLSAQQVEQILAVASTIVPLDGAEITMEANPGTVLGRDYLRDLRSLGVNRISMGVQSLDDPTLRVLGRIHSADEARRSYEDARAAGFTRINLDFIFGLPGQTVAQWEHSLDEIITWGADHFSLYSLIVEENTPLHAQVVGGRISVPDDDATGAMYEAAITRFADAGYAQYEISNWARTEEVPTGPGGLPGQACHHNLAYWLNADYLACGAGAHGHVYPQRYADVLKIDDYIGVVTRGALPTAQTTDLSPTDLMAETMMMGLRLNAGVNYAHFKDRCGVELTDVYATQLTELTEQGLLESSAMGVRLTPRGRMVGNQVFLRFV